MKKNPFSYLFLAMTVVLYLFIAFTSPENALLSLEKSLKILAEILPILTVVLILTAAMNILIPSKAIRKYLGQESGKKGWFIAIAGGVLSHGSTYIWYSILQDFRLHGAKNGLVIAFFYARAIKLPWLPMMISYFGLSFTLILSLYILIAAFLQGLIAERLLKQTKLPADHNPKQDKG
jgi:uncharacterized membrane protein YraQ (UPF0718 family)